MSVTYSSVFFTSPIFYPENSRLYIRLLLLEQDCCLTLHLAFLQGTRTFVEETGPRNRQSGIPI